MSYAPIANEGFFVTHFFTVRDQEKSKDFYVRILGGKVIKSENPLLHQAGQYLDHSQFRWRPDSGQARCDPGTAFGSQQSDQLPQLACRRHLGLLQGVGRQRAFFLTEPLDNHGWEWRCYMRDPDGYLIEVGQYTPLALAHFNKSAG